MKSINNKIKNWFIRSLPNFLWPIKYLIIKNSINKVGANFRFGEGSVFSEYERIEIGNNCFMGERTLISTNTLVSIGSNVMFGPEVMLIGGDHNFKEIGVAMNKSKTGGKNQPIIIEDDVWIGARATILKGVRIAEGAVIGAGSLVLKDIPPYSINVGAPSRTLKSRFCLTDLELHLQKVHSKYSVNDVIKAYNKIGLELKE